MTRHQLRMRHSKYPAEFGWPGNPNPAARIADILTDSGEDSSPQTTSVMDASMFDDRFLDPRSGLTLLCLFTACIFWQSDTLFLLFAGMAVCTRFVLSSSDW